MCTNRLDMGCMGARKPFERKKFSDCEDSSREQLGMEENPKA